MIAFKCKMCGGELSITDGSSICECEFCGTRQTIPTADSDKKVNLFNRANRLRMGAEFDKAATVYASITAEFPEEAEAYWGLCLCKYGIEYVDDPLTGNKIPTCHRTLTASILDDSDFDQACEYADVESKKLYREEAKAIDKLQQDILNIVASEEPFDVFICYKETDNEGERTEDSVIAQEIYDSLTDKGLKVFFARITLEDKLGKEYEPYIYAALHSSKVMLAVGTQFGYYDAVWVKNEWARYLDMMKTDKSKTLIPCFKGIDAYDMPREFKNLQALDMSKLGWLQDLTRGVLKLCGKDDHSGRNAPANQEIHTTGNPTGASLLKRAFICLEDGEWNKAYELAEQVLNAEPENAEAYLAQLMARYQIPNRESLAKAKDPYEGSMEFQRAVRFGDSALQKELTDANETIKDRNHTALCDSTLEEARNLIKNGKKQEDMTKAISLLQTIPGWKNAGELIPEAEQKKEKIRKDEIYNDGKKYMKAGHYPLAMEEFQKIPGWRDADTLMEESGNRLAAERKTDADNQRNYDAFCEQRRQKADELRQELKQTESKLQGTDSKTRDGLNRLLSYGLCIWGIGFLIVAGIGLLAILMGGGETNIVLSIVFDAFFAISGALMLSYGKKTIKSRLEKKKNLTARKEELMNEIKKVEAPVSFTDFVRQMK